MRQPGIQGTTQIHHARTAIGVQHVEIQRYSGFQIGKLEQAFHHHFRLYAAGLWLQNDTNIFCRLIAYIAKERQFFCLQHFCKAFNQPRFLHLIGNFGDNDVPRTGLLTFHIPFCPHTKATTAGCIGITNGFRRLHEDAAGWKVRPANKL